MHTAALDVPRLSGTYCQPERRDARGIISRQHKDASTSSAQRPSEKSSAALGTKDREFGCHKYRATSWISSKVSLGKRKDNFLPAIAFFKVIF